MRPHDPFFEEDLSLPAPDSTSVFPVFPSSVSRFTTCGLQVQPGQEGPDILSGEFFSLPVLSGTEPVRVSMVSGRLEQRASCVVRTSDGEWNENGTRMDPQGEGDRKKLYGNNFHWTPLH